MFLGFSYLRLAGFAAILILVFGGIYYVHHLQTENATLTTQVASLNLMIKSQNDAITKWSQDAKAREAAGKIALAEAQKQSVVYRDRAKIIYKTLPSKPTDLCGSALDLVNGATP